MKKSKSPLDRLAKLERKRANDIDYQTRRAAYREDDLKEAWKSFWAYCSVGITLQALVTVAWGHEVAWLLATAFIGGDFTDDVVFAVGIVASVLSAVLVALMAAYASTLLDHASSESAELRRTLKAKKLSESLLQRIDSGLGPK